MSQPNFIGFEPADFKKGMETLDNVIRLQAKVKEKVEQSRGYESDLAKDNEKRAKPINDEIAKQNALMLTYSSAKDIAEAKFQVNNSKKLKDDMDAKAAASNDQGDFELAAVYGLQLEYAKAKLDYLTAVQSLTKAKTPKEKKDRIKVVDDTMTEFQDALDMFTSANIPAGFVQAVDIRTIPAQPQGLLGAAQQQGQIILAQQGQQQGQPSLPTSEEFFKELQDQQQIAGRMELDAEVPNVIFFVSPAGAAGPVTVRDVDGKNPIVGDPFEVDGVAGLKFTKTGSREFKISYRRLRPIIETPWDQLDEPLLKSIVQMYVELYTNKKKLKIADDWAAFGIKPLIDQNPNYKAVITVANKAGVGKGIIGDVIKVITPKMPGKRGPSMKRPKLAGDMFGNVRIDLPALHNQGRIRVFDPRYIGNHGGKIIMDEAEENVEGFGLRRLMLTRVMQKTLDSAPPKVRKQYDRLLKLANADVPKGSGVTKSVKTTRKPQIVLVGDGADLAQRLKIAVGEYGAGNDSSENIQLITELAHQMFKLGKISADRYKQIVESVA